MEMELEPRVKPLGYKVKGMSRESPAQKGSHVLDSDLRSYWSSGTNTKEWILLELDEPCLLSHIRIYNKSVLEWEISVGLRYKPETFVKVRPRCEAPRRDIMYPMNYTPCRYVRISCLRGNPIAIFFVQLIGVPVSGLEAEFQPVVNHLLPDIISHKQDSSNMHLQLLQEITNRLLVFVPQLEADLASFTDAPEQSIRFLAMLAGPFYPILHVVKERESARTSSNISDAEVSRSSQSSSLITVSSNFEPRRPRGMFHVLSTTSSSLVFRPDAVFAMLRKAYKDSDLGTVCKMASRILHKLVEPVTVLKASQSGNDVSSALDDMAKSDLHPLLVDYSSLFGEEFQMPNDEWDSSLFNLLDIGAVEEGILHVLFACASQPLFCCKLVENASEFWSALPLVQALLPALRPSVNNLSDSIDDSFSLWKQSLVQQALSEIVSTSCSALYRPLLHTCAGYLASYSSSHVKAACILLDLCSSVLAPWMSQVVAKVDLAVELLEDLLGAIQGANRCLVRARAALKYIILAISGHMDDVLGKYKEVKHKILFLLEMLEPFLDPAIYAWKSSIAFGDVSFSFLEKQEQSCMTALNIIRIAVEKPAVLPALETEWRRGLVPPSVLLSILEPHMQLPPEIDMCKSSMNKDLKHEASGAPHSSVLGYGGASSKTNSQDEMDGKVDISDSTAKTEICEDASLLFAPHELRNMAPTSISAGSNENVLETDHKASNSEVRHLIEKKLNHLFNNGIVLDVGFAAEFFNSQVDYYQLINYHDCELRASDFRRLAVDLQMQNEIVDEAHHTAVDALLLAAECYVNPFFLMPFRINSKLDNAVSISRNRNAKFGENFELRSAFKKTGCDIETISILEKKRDKIVLELLLEAANLDKKFHTRTSDGGLHEGIEKQVLKLFPDDIPCADAVTLLRQNQASLCTFLIERLKKDQQSMHEILLHCLVFLLHSATQLYCSPEEVIDIILQSAEDLNTLLTSFYSQSKEESIRLDPEKVHWIQRRWMLLQRMVVASSGNEGSDFSVNIKNGYRCGKLIPPSAWIQRIPTFSCSTYPLVRFIGWMAVSRNAQQYTKEGLALASDLSQLTCLLSIYRDDLTAVENIINKKYVVQKKEFSEVKQDLPVGEVLEPANHQLGDQSFHVLYPDLCKFFPNMKRQFESFGEDILVAVGLQLRSLSSTLVPDILCWLSDLCSWPFLQGCKIASQNCSRYLKGYVSKNAKAIILYILEAIVVEHMEAMVPEIPRVVQVLISLCRSPYFDVSFLDSVMRLLKPIILHALHKVSDEEINMVEESCLNFESLCFDELFVVIRQQNDGDKSSEHDYNQAMLIFILACVFTDLSFRNKRDILESLASWANFTNFEPSASFRDYLLAFQAILESCKVLLVQSLKSVDAIPLQMPYTADADTVSLSSNMPEAESWFLNDVCSSSTPLGSDKPGNDKCDVIDSKKKDYCLTLDDIEGFSADLENLISKLILNIERSWNLHYSLARNLTIVSAECSMYMKCLSKTMSQHQIADEGSCENSEHKPNTQFLVHWKVALAWLAQTVVELQNSHCWDVAAVMLDCLLGVPRCFLLDNVVDTICSAIKHSCYSAPKMPWRLRSDKWLSILLVRVAHDLQEGHTFLSNLFVALLDHYEPEQRFIALQHLGRLVGYDINGESAFEPSKYCNKLVSPKAVAEQFLSHLVSSTWDKVILLASSDALLSLRTRALALLIGYIPYAEAHQLQTFLSAADTVLPVLGKILYPACEGPMLRLSLALVLGACLYSPAEDVSLMPQDVWRNIETIGLSRTGGHFGDLEKNACKVLCRLRDEGEEAKEPLKEVLASGFPKQPDPKFISTRETVLQVLSDLTSVDSYFDMFSKKIEENEMELEEAEIELEILQKENATEEFSKGIEQEIPLAIASVKGDNRLQQIKEQINSIEKAKLQQDILARRQKKLFMRHARRKYLEEAALREEELLRELDREKTAEAEKEIERHKLLELERAKTRELRHNLDMEKERQTQRDLQRELEQVAETGLRSSRRDFSTSTARSRDRYRERENGRSSNEGIARTGSASLPPEISATSAPLTVPTVVLSGSRSFSGQPPTILQSRDRSDEGGSSYEENFDGSKDSGDTGSVGEPDLISAFDTQSGGYGSAQRHGSRGSRSRQVMERRERDGRREGKWERKHS